MAQHLLAQTRSADLEGTLVRIIEVHRETVLTDDGAVQCSARCRPRLARDMAEQGVALTVGDWALCSPDPHQPVWIEARLAPLTHIARRDADGSRHAVVSNIDTAFLVMGLDLDFNAQRLERYLALAQGSSVIPVVVLTKADVLTLQGDAVAVSERMAQLRHRIGHAVDMVALDARTVEAATALAPYLGSGQSVVLLGSSGAGKSTLTNTLIGAPVQDTGGVREHDSRGKHTTTSRSLHRLRSGACVIDTPGLRTLSPDVSDAMLGASFDDVVTLASRCRFRDCQHGEEPGCAVREGVHPQRLRNYQKLLREVRREQVTVLGRQQQLAQWKARGRAGRQRLEMKRRAI